MRPQTKAESHWQWEYEHAKDRAKWGYDGRWRRYAKRQMHKARRRAPFEDYAGELAEIMAEEERYACS